MSPSTLRYREARPSPALRPWVECFWTSTGTGTPGERYRVLPDGCMDVIFVLGDPPSLPDGAQGARAIVVGTQRAPLDVERNGTLDLLGVRFRSGALPAFLPVAADALVDRGLPLADAGDPRWSALHDQVADSPAAERVGRIDAFLTGRLATSAPDRLVARAVRLLTGEGRLETAGAVADHLGVGRRTLERRFRDHVGLGPATLARVLRFRAASDALRAGAHGSLASLAVRFGYADQPHLTRDVREFAGTTPARLRRGGLDG